MDLLTRSPLCDSHREEVASLVTHSVATVLSAVVLLGMLMLAGGEFFKTVAAGVFGVSLVVLYASSSLYHWFTSPRWKSRFQALDHACIYLLIAGSYTPVSLVTLRGTWGWWMFGIVWGLALVGVWVKLVMKRRRDHWISTVLYLVMGWLILFAFGPLVRSLPMAGVWWLVAGGFTYSLGIVFYKWERLPFHHAIWHVFVMGGSACHVVAVVRYVLR